MCYQSIQPGMSYQSTVYNVGRVTRLYNLGCVNQLDVLPVCITWLYRGYLVSVLFVQGLGTKVIIQIILYYNYYDTLLLT